MQESMSKDFSYNHPFELAYWQYGLTVANQWRERMGKPRHAEWDKISQNMAPLPLTKDGVITAGLPKGKTTGLKSFDPFDAVAAGAAPVLATETFTDKCRNDHPACVGAFGLLPVCCDSVAAKKTMDWVMKNWNFQTTWGWDYGMMAMAAARIGDTKTALDALLIDTQKNTYLKNGHPTTSLPARQWCLAHCRSHDVCRLGRVQGSPEPRVSQGWHMECPLGGTASYAITSAIGKKRSAGFGLYQGRYFFIRCYGIVVWHCHRLTY